MIVKLYLPSTHSTYAKFRDAMVFKILNTKGLVTRTNLCSQHLCALLGYTFSTLHFKLVLQITLNKLVNVVIKYSQTITSKHPLIMTIIRPIVRQLAWLLCWFRTLNSTGTFERHIFSKTIIVK